MRKRFFLLSTFGLIVLIGLIAARPSDRTNAAAPTKFVERKLTVGFTYVNTYKNRLANMEAAMKQMQSFMDDVKWEQNRQYSFNRDILKNNLRTEDGYVNTPLGFGFGSCGASSLLNKMVQLAKFRDADGKEKPVFSTVMIWTWRGDKTYGQYGATIYLDPTGRHAKDYVWRLNPAYDGPTPKIVSTFDINAQKAEMTMVYYDKVAESSQPPVATQNGPTPIPTNPALQITPEPSESPTTATPEATSAATSVATENISATDPAAAPAVAQATATEQATQAATEATEAATEAASPAVPTLVPTLVPVTSGPGTATTAATAAPTGKATVKATANAVAPVKATLTLVPSPTRVNTKVPPPTATIRIQPTATPFQTKVLLNVDSANSVLSPAQNAEQLEVQLNKLAAGYRFGVSIVPIGRATEVIEETGINQYSETYVASAFKGLVTLYFLENVDREIWGSVPVKFWDWHIKDEKEVDAPFRDAWNKHKDLLNNVWTMQVWSQNDSTGNVMDYVWRNTKMHDKGENAIIAFNNWMHDVAGVSKGSGLKSWYWGKTLCNNCADERYGKLAFVYNTRILVPTNTFSPRDLAQGYVYLATKGRELGYYNVAVDLMSQWRAPNAPSMIQWHLGRKRGIESAGKDGFVGPADQDSDGFYISTDAALITLPDGKQFALALMAFDSGNLLDDALTMVGNSILPPPPKKK